MKLSVLIPCFNEKRTLAELVRRVQASPYEPKEIVIVDDASTDGTREMLKNGDIPGVDRVILLDKNQGKGAALRAGLSAVSGDVVVIQDADLEYDPANYGKLLQPILDGHADVVYGSRFSGPDAHRVLYFWHRVAMDF